MWHFRQIVLLLSSLAVLLASGLGRGFVLCVGEDGVARVEASDVEGTCRLANGAAERRSADQSRMSVCSATTCNDCQDFAFAERSTQISSAPADLHTDSAPLVLVWLVSRVNLSLDHASADTRHVTPFLGGRSSDLYAVRETVILLI